MGMMLRALDVICQLLVTQYKTPTHFYVDLRVDHFRFKVFPNQVAKIHLLYSLLFL